MTNVQHLSFVRNGVSDLAMTSSQETVAVGTRSIVQFKFTISLTFFEYLTKCIMYSETTRDIFKNESYK